MPDHYYTLLQLVCHRNATDGSSAPFTPPPITSTKCLTETPLRTGAKAIRGARTTWYFGHSAFYFVLGHSKYVFWKTQSDGSTGIGRRVFRRHAILLWLQMLIIVRTDLLFLYYIYES